MFKSSQKIVSLLTLKVVFLGMVLFQIEDAFAKQVIKLKADDEVSIWVSNIELNRIQAVDDRVKYIRANEGELELISDKELGEIYIKPKELEATHIFITTEKGFTYKVGLKVDQIAAQQIFLKNEDAAVKEAAKNISRILPEREAALDAIKQVRESARQNNKLFIPSGYIEVKPDKYLRKSGYKLIGDKKYKSENYILEKFLVQVDKGIKGKVAEESFFEANVIAVSLDRVLGAGDKGYVYIVKRKS